MDIKQLIHDDDAVSPVIGVILMVAITVILAAVIASFVLGLGDQAQQATPQASFSWDYDQSAAPYGTLTVTHDGGDTISGQEMYIRGSGITSDGDTPSTSEQLTDSNSGNTWGTAASTSEITAGNQLTIAVENNYDLRVVYETQEGDSSATLAQDSGPEA
ncbi:type IV pilin [Haloarcula sp. CBA1127]|uniref:type IV pilin n=1 Tax=Haloarcula sp. CBA1127 TaxID=1765055 RepID=UPI00073EC0A7|nr:type IV pilin N-terminal domain-containing protein [Haloarcula sp. CBA1127]